MASNGHADDEGGAMGQEKINPDIVTLTRFLTEEQTKYKTASGDFTYGRPTPTPPTARADRPPGSSATRSNSPSSRSRTTFGARRSST